MKRRRNQKPALIVYFLTLLLFYFLTFVFADDFTYNSKGKRDPFIPLVGPGAVYQVKGGEDIASIEDISIEGIVYDEKGGSMAIINGMPLKEGAQIGAFIIDKIEPKKVIFDVEGEKHEVALGGAEKEE